MASGNIAWKPQESEDGSIHASGYETILLVEDEFTVRKFLLSVLQQVGYRVIEAEDGRQALKLIDDSDEHIHLLLTDVMMANMGGRELASQLAAKRPEMKVLFMSGYAQEVNPKGWDSRQGFEFLQKPFSPGVLAQKVRAVLDSSRVPAN
jgi:DNA-binding NtrC family response regulator